MFGQTFLALQASGALTTVTCYDDRYRAAKGVVVQAEDGAGGTATLVTDGRGSTPQFPLPHYDIATITLGELGSRQGILLGTRYTVLTPPDPSSQGLGAWYLDVELSQPLATREVIEGSPTTYGYFTPPDTLSWWGVAVSPGSEIRFSTAIACLPNNREIAGALSYLGFAAPQVDDYEVGVFLEMPAVNLGAETPEVFVQIEAEYSGFAAEPALDAFLLVLPPHPGDPPTLPLVPLNASLADWTNELATVALVGTCQKGKLFLLLREQNGTPGSTTVVHYTPPVLEIPENGGGEQASTGAAAPPEEGASSPRRQPPLPRESRTAIRRRRSPRARPARPAHLPTRTTAR